MALVPQLHAEPYRSDQGIYSEWVELHTYEDASLLWVNVHGNNSDDTGQSVELLLNETEVRALRDALNKYLGEEKPDGRE